MIIIQIKSLRKDNSGGSRVDSEYNKETLEYNGVTPEIIRMSLGHKTRRCRLRERERRKSAEASSYGE
jgi:hypothetical protein